MELTLKGTPEEIAKMLQAIGSSKEQNETDICVDAQAFRQVLSYIPSQREHILSSVKGIDHMSSKEDSNIQGHLVTNNIFEGLSFKCPPVSKEEFVRAYEDYVKRCSG
ncbi:hypothetical protein [Enterococcus larvae]|uniref:hypothetical protein n=1 Tax=Enterococcus larvae TaxID=2794352 RepID=UPI003F3B087A